MTKNSLKVYFTLVTLIILECSILCIITFIKSKFKIQKNIQNKYILY